MKILSLDTTMAACSAAVIDTAARFRWLRRSSPWSGGHAEALPPMVAELMRTSGLDYGDIDRIAVTIGPGTFTGVRIGLSFARGLGLARGIPVIGIDCLTAIAANETARRPLLVVSDARNDEVYAASFDADRTLISGPCIKAATLVDLPAHGLVIGTAAYAVLAASGRSDVDASSAGDLPVAANFARLAEKGRACRHAGTALPARTRRQTTVRSLAKSRPADDRIPVPLQQRRFSRRFTPSRSRTAGRQRPSRSTAHARRHRRDCAGKR